MSKHMSNDFIYWTFSAAAQSISTFVAFLITGYALVHTLMESAREKDDSLEEIHLELLSNYHKRLTILVWLTGAAVIFSILMIYFNRSNATVPNWLVLFVGIVDLAAIIQGLAFVISIVDPKKYRKAAEKVLEQTQPEPGPSRQEQPAAVFFDAFRDLERLVRDYLKQKDLYIPSRGSPRMSYSFRQMIDAIFQNEKIDHLFYEDLLEINKYRNLVFHGHVDKADLTMVQRVRAAAEQIEHLE
jgi:hypothetical protein